MKRYETTKKVLRDELKVLKNSLTNLIGEANKKKRESNSYIKAANSVTNKISAIETVLKHLNGGK